jgi:outer membrane immunogenic protein
MKRFLMAGAAIALSAGAAVAADVSAPFKVAPVAVAPFYSWTGCYAGIHGGGAAIRDSLASTWSDGGLFGGQVGCNYQIDHLVIGVEGEGTWSGVSSTQTLQLFTPGVPATVTTFRNQWQADVAVRFGIAYDRFFFYQKIGVIWGDDQFATSNNAFLGANAISGQVTVPGLLWGLGFEYGLTPQWTAKVETDFAYFAATDMNVSCTSSAAAPACGGLGGGLGGGPVQATGNGIFSTNAVAVITKLGLNYRF